MGAVLIGIAAAENLVKRSEGGGYDKGMVESLHSLLSGILDYAGLFPPAALPLEQAVRQYARHRHEGDAWLLGRFVCPAAKLMELKPLLPVLPAETRLTVLA